jgi:transposase
MYSIELDISKLTIDIFIPINKSNIQITNNAKSIQSFYFKLKKL